MMRRAIWFFSVIVMFGASSSVHAQKKWETAKYLGMAREALSLGEMEKWEKALKMADRSFEQEKTKMSFSERNNQKLWLTLFWSKYHQFRGALPEVKNAKDFETIKALEAHISKTEDSIRHLKKGLKYLRSYNLMYMQVAQRSNLQNQIYLQASLSLERDLEGTIRQGNIYSALLRYIRQNWNDKKAIKRRLASAGTAIKTLQQKQKSSDLRQQEIRKEQKKIAQVVEKAQASYLVVQRNMRRQAQLATVMTWSGVAAMVLSAGGLITGIYFIVDAQNPVGKSALERQLAYDRGLVITIISTAVFVLGAGSTITGIAINPGDAARDKAVLGSHNKYLDIERNKLNKSSSLPSKNKKHKLVRLPPSNPRGLILLGTW